MTVNDTIVESRFTEFGTISSRQVTLQVGQSISIVNV